MASKRPLSATEQHRYRQILQSATIGALMDSRRWAPGDLAFQGGTSLHLVHGSARFSEDLDFMVRGGLSLGDLAKSVQRRLQRLPGVPPELSVTVSTPTGERNPHAFMVTLGGPNVIGSAKVKVELWSTPGEALDSLKLLIKPIASPSGAQAFVPTLSLDEVVADKVYALGARDRLKARDVFDLWWLCEQQGASLSADALLTRLSIYPAPQKGSGTRETAENWLASAEARLATLADPSVVKAVAMDLLRWLPSSWKMDQAVAAQMLSASARWLDQGIERIREAYPVERAVSAEVVRERG